MKMIRDLEIDSIIGKKRLIPAGTDFSNRELLIIRASSYGDYFFVSPVIDKIRACSKNCEIIYVANGKLDLSYIYDDNRIDEVIEVFKLNNDWQDEHFEMNEFAARRLRELIADPEILILSYEATDGDYMFGDYSCNGFGHYLKMAGFDADDLSRLKMIYPIIFNRSFMDFRYIVFHPFSSQPGRCWPDFKIREFIEAYDLKLPAIMLGLKEEGEYEFSANKNIHDWRSKTSFIGSIKCIQNSVFGIYTESCLMHAAQFLRKPSIITHLHPWTKRFTEPYHDKTWHIVARGQPDWDTKELLSIMEVVNEAV